MEVPTMMEGRIDLRSDTVTWPTPEMRLAMASAAVGDDVYGDDPTVNELESYAASLLGKEAALFAVSGTMGNQLALMSMVGRGDEVILSERCHIVQHEAGAAAILSGAQLRCLPVSDGRMDLDDVERTIRKDPSNIHSPRTALICLENADSDGHVLDIGYQENIRRLADHYQVLVHLDGARLFNAASVLQATPAEATRNADTIQICLSKGLCAPVGSLLVGKQNIIDLARRKRKILGGGMRQAGVLAAAGLLALKDMTGRVSEDHARAKWLAAQLSMRPDYFEVISEPEINMVFFRLKHYPLTAGQLVRALREQQILVNEPDEGIFRLVTHYWVDSENLVKLVGLLDQLAMTV
jgi:threonine aldolase